MVGRISRRFTDVAMVFGGRVLRAEIMAKAFYDDAKGTRLYLVRAVEIDAGVVGKEPGVSGQSRRAIGASSPPPSVSERFGQIVIAVKGGHGSSMETPSCGVVYCSISRSQDVAGSVVGAPLEIGGDSYIGTAIVRRIKTHSVCTCMTYGLRRESGPPSRPLPVPVTRVSYTGPSPDLLGRYSTTATRSIQMASSMRRRERRAWSSIQETPRNFAAFDPEQVGRDYGLRAGRRGFLFVNTPGTAESSRNNLRPPSGRVIPTLARGRRPKTAASIGS